MNRMTRALGAAGMAAALLLAGCTIDSSGPRAAEAAPAASTTAPTAPDTAATPRTDDVRLTGQMDEWVAALLPFLGGQVLPRLQEALTTLSTGGGTRTPNPQKPDPRSPAPGVPARTGAPDAPGRSGGASSGEATRRLAGRVIVLDPGHPGRATAEMMSRQVPDGRGGTKACQTAGTASPAGFAEHTLNWQVTQDLRSILEAMGATVHLTRADDTSAGGCIDERVRRENAWNADIVVSIHADGARPNGRGFHVSYVDPPIAGVTDQAASRFLAENLRGALVHAGIPASNYLGVDGIHPRADLTGLNMSTRPKALVELGNMQNVDDLTLMRSDDGRRRYAVALAAGVIASLN